MSRTKKTKIHNRESNSFYVELLNHGWYPNTGLLLGKSLFCSFCIFSIFNKKGWKNLFSAKKMIVTSERRAEHPFAGQNTQHWSHCPRNVFCFLLHFLSILIKICHKIFKSVFYWTILRMYHRNWNVPFVRGKYLSGTTLFLRSSIVQPSIPRTCRNPDNSIDIYHFVPRIYIIVIQPSSAATCNG